MKQRLIVSSALASAVALGLIGSAAALRGGLQIGRAFFRGCFHMAQHGKRNHRITLRELDAAHAG